MTSEASTKSFSMFDPHIMSDPAEFYAEIHRNGAVYKVPETGTYVIAGYDELTSALRDQETFSSDIGDNYFQIQGEGAAERYREVLRARGWDHVKTLQRTDPPAHSRYRVLVSKAFSTKNVNALKPRIANICHYLIDSFIDKGRCEFVRDFALPLPSMIIAEELGLDKDDFMKFKRWSDILISTATVPMSHDELMKCAESELELQHFLANRYEERRREPRSDIISHLVAAGTEEEQPLSMEEFQNVMHQLISGGFDTTTSAIAHSLWLLLRYPEQMSRLRADPQLLTNFINESLRFESPVQGLMRRTTRDVEVDGTKIPEGAHVIVRYGAANRDPEQFECPAKFDIARENAGAHLGFGTGPHLCIGRLLAVAEIRTSFEILLDRLHSIQLDGELPEIPHEPNFLLHPLKVLPIAFERA